MIALRRALVVFLQRFQAIVSRGRSLHHGRSEKCDSRRLSRHDLLEVLLFHVDIDFVALTVDQHGVQLHGDELDTDGGQGRIAGRAVHQLELSLDAELGARERFDGAFLQLLDEQLLDEPRSRSAQGAFLLELFHDDGFLVLAGEKLLKFLGKLRRGGGISSVALAVRGVRRRNKARRRAVVRGRLGMRVMGMVSGLLMVCRRRYSGQTFARASGLWAVATSLKRQRRERGRILRWRVRLVGGRYKPEAPAKGARPDPSLARQACGRSPQA